jgi:hypothetical protein
MPETDVFAYGKSGLSDFLFAEIGIEQNGSSLTVLSALARNGDDPWDKAAHWAKAPRAEVIELLAAAIRRSPLATEAIDGAHVTAARLVQLLPAPARLWPDASPAGGLTRLQWGCVMLLVGSIAIAFAVTAAVSPRPNGVAGHRGTTPPANSSVTAG